jgi:hypothetical protein
VAAIFLCSLVQIPGLLWLNYIWSVQVVWAWAGEPSYAESEPYVSEETRQLHPSRSDLYCIQLHSEASQAHQVNSSLLLPSFIKKCPQRIQYYLEWEKMLLEFTILAPMSSIATHPSGFPNQKTRSTALSDARILPDQGSSISIMIP